MRRWVRGFLAVAAMMGAAGACSSFEASEPGPAAPRQQRADQGAPPQQPWRSGRRRREESSRRVVLDARRQGPLPRERRLRLHARRAHRARFADLRLDGGVEAARHFRRVTLDVSRTPCAGVAVRLSVEGAAESSCASLGTGDPFTHGAALTMQLGLVSSGKWAETAIPYDDVTVDFD